jgi:hypothetical protein
MTCKRARDEQVPAQLAKHYVGFHPIFESVSSFLGIKDCARCAELSREFANKLWVYVLRSVQQREMI